LVIWRFFWAVGFVFSVNLIFSPPPPPPLKNNLHEKD
jgi:hypothetical protein